MLYLAYLGCVAMVVVQGTFAGYHYLPGMAVGSILIGSAFTLGVAAVEERFPRLAAPRQQLLLTVILLALMAPRYISATSIRSLVHGRFLQPPVPGEFRSGRPCRPRAPSRASSARCSPAGGPTSTAVRGA